MKPFFSIITPVLNRVDLIKRAINSVEKQDYKNYEFIIVDNGSVDGTLEYCKSLIGPQLRVIQCYDRGVAFSRNKGIRSANGEWIIILDSDNQFIDENVLYNLTLQIKKFNQAKCILTSNLNERGETISFCNCKDTYLSFEEYLNSSGEFTPMVRRTWYMNNLHKEIKGIINEFSLLVFTQSAIENTLILSSYNAQIYNTIGDDRICSNNITSQKAFELSLYYRLLLEKYGEMIVKKVYLLFVIWSLKYVTYGKISNKIKLKELFNQKISFAVFPIFILPNSLLRYVVERSKQRKL